MIETKAKFYYGIVVDSTNNKLDFDEGGGELTATITYGSYTPTELVAEIQAQLNAAGAFTYTVSMNRTTRIITIAADSAMTLLTLTGTNALTTIFTELGYAEVADTSSATSHAADTAFGTEYVPQFLLQSYVGPDDWVEPIHATVNETVDGTQELVSYGSKNMMQFNITLISDIAQPSNGWIDNNASAVAEARSFLSWLAAKNKVEFMPDKDTVATFDNYILTKSPKSKDGTIVYLKELYARKLKGYYETGILEFRKVS